MAKMRSWGFLLAAFLLGCAHSGTRVERVTGIDFSRYHRIGVLPFTDSRDQGRHIAEGIENGLRQLHYTVVDGRILEQILAKNKPDDMFGFNLEALTDVRMKTSADAILVGVMASDWHGATVTLVETELGDSVFRGYLKPGDKRKTFSSPKEVVVETMRVFGAELTPQSGQKP